MKRVVNLMLDSGAFSVWRSGKTIDLKSYIAFVQDHLPYLHSYINLDVIPGRPGEARNLARVEACAEVGWANLLRMRKEGLEPMPVYHMGERRYWLEKMIGEGFKYIGLGGVAAERDVIRRPWLDEVFGYLSGNQGYPTIKVHGLGILSVELVHRYPWASTDSTSWQAGQQTGSIFVPRPKLCGGYDYSVSPMVIRVATSVAGVSRVVLGSAHIATFGRQMKKYVEHYLQEQQLDLRELGNSRIWRLRAAIRFFQQVVAHHPLRPFRSRPLLWSAGAALKGRLNPIQPYRLFYALHLRGEVARVFDAEGVRDILISYEDVGSRGSIVYFVCNGVLKPKETKRVRINIVR